jgi:hypothetical protein
MKNKSMKFKLKTIKYYGVPSEEHEHDIYVKVKLFPKGTERKVKVLSVPSFKVVEMMQVATIEKGYTPNDGIKYAYNKWNYIEK